MSVTVSLELSKRDLAFFRAQVRAARRALRDVDENLLIDAVDAALEDYRSHSPLPDFLNRHLGELHTMTAMLRDDEWQLPRAERERLLATLIYFADPDDGISDNLPGIGFLDDAIMIELALREMCHVRDAYRDFCAWRESYSERYRTGHDDGTRQKRLAAKRRALQARMKRRRAREMNARRMKVLW